MIRMALNVATGSHSHVKLGPNRIDFSRLDRIRTGAGKRGRQSVSKTAASKPYMTTPLLRDKIMPAEYRLENTTYVDGIEILPLQKGRNNTGEEAFLHVPPFFLVLINCDKNVSKTTGWSPLFLYSPPRYPLSLRTS